MVKVKLYTEAGEYVTQGQIPPFLTPPVILVWGERFFRLYKQAPECLEYREAFTYFLVTEASA